MALDHPDRVTRLAVLDIVPTHYLYTHVTLDFVQAYFHWFNYLRAAPAPENQLKEDIERQASRDDVRRASSNISACAAIRPTSTRCARTIAPARVDRSRARQGRSRQEDRVSAAGAVGREGADGPPLRRAGDLAGAGEQRSPAARCPTGHNLQEDAPDLVHAELRAFLKGAASPMARRRIGRFSQRHG